jgi:hypothetical protein
VLMLLKTTLHLLAKAQYANTVDAERTFGAVVDVLLVRKICIL